MRKVLFSCAVVVGIWSGVSAAPPLTFREIPLPGFHALPTEDLQKAMHVGSFAGDVVELLAVTSTHGMVRRAATVLAQLGAYCDLRKGYIGIDAAYNTVFRIPERIEHMIYADDIARALKHMTPVRRRWLRRWRNTELLLLITEVFLRFSDSDITQGCAGVISLLRHYEHARQQSNLVSVAQKMHKNDDKKYNESSDV